MKHRMEKLYRMLMHDHIALHKEFDENGGNKSGETVNILRVPGGWIYNWRSPVFVPFTEEPNPDNLHEAIRYITSTPGMTADLAITILMAVK